MESKKLYEAHTGRKQNLNHKRDFRPQPLMAERQNAVPAQKKGSTNG